MFTAGGRRISLNKARFTTIDGELVVPTADSTTDPRAAG